MNWGEFETEIQKVTKSERVIIFAGPVLSASDRWFRGEDQNGAVRVQIPSRFWKIVVSKGQNGPEAFGFIFEQDLIGITEKELAFSRKWRDSSVPLNEIEVVCRGYLDFSNLKSIDRFGDIDWT